jgi:hypothetical protein
MLAKDHNQLIFDTLHYRPPPGGRRFVVNEPGLRLIEGDALLLSPIKAALLEAAQSRNWEQLYGLGYVIGAFLILGTKHAPDTLVPFIVSLPPAFQKEVIAAIPVFFQKNKRTGNYNFSEAPTRELIEFVKQLSCSEDSELQRTAQRVVKLI